MFLLVTTSAAAESAYISYILVMNAALKTVIENVTSIRHSNIVCKCQSATFESRIPYFRSIQMSCYGACFHGVKKSRDNSYAGESCGIWYHTVL